MGFNKQPCGLYASHAAKQLSVHQAAQEKECNISHFSPCYFLVSA